jgi:cell wall-associated NlpC family hydrolase
MRIRTLVLIALVALLGVLALKANTTQLPTSHNQSSANAPQVKVNKKDIVAINDYISSRESINASRSSLRTKLSNKIANTGKSYIGVPYCKGGTTPKCFDCSGFVKYVYNKQGFYIPRMANDQLNNMVRISKDKAKPGDLVFFLSKNGYAYHVGIYMGNNKVLHSPKPKSKVKIEKIWSKRVVYAKY